MTETGDYLRALREARGLTKYRVEREIALSHSPLWHVEVGRRLPTVATVRLLAAYYGLTAAERRELVARIGRDHAAPYADALCGGE